MPSGFAHRHRRRVWWMRISVDRQQPRRRRACTAAAAGSGCRGSRRTAGSRQTKTITVRSRTDARLEQLHARHHDQQRGAGFEAVQRAVVEQHAEQRGERERDAQPFRRQSPVLDSMASRSADRARARAAAIQSLTCGTCGTTASARPATTQTRRCSAGGQSAARRSECVPASAIVRARRTAPAPSGSAADEPGRCSAGSRRPAVAGRRRGRPRTHPRSSGTAATAALRCRARSARPSRTKCEVTAVPA